MKEKRSCTAIFQRDCMITTKLNQEINLFSFALFANNSLRMTRNGFFTF